MGRGNRATLCVIVLTVLAVRGHARPRISFDLLANQSLLSERAGSPEPFGSQVEKVHAMLRLRPRVSLGRGFELQTPLGIVLPGNVGADGNVLVFRSHLGFLLSRHLSQRWALGLGPGIEWRNYFSSGGAVELRNGITTKTFYTPSGSQAVVLLVVCASVEWFWRERISFASDLFVENIGNPQRRSFAFALGMGFHI